MAKVPYMTVINPLQHPQALFVGFAADDPRLARMQRLVGAYQVQAECHMDGLRPGDWDVLVVEGQLIQWRVPDHLQVLAFATPDYGRMATDLSTAVPAGRQHGRTLHLGEHLSEDVRWLLRSEAFPWLEDQQTYPFLRRKGWNSESTVDLNENQIASSESFISDADGNIVVGSFKRGANSWCWALPYQSKTPDLWLAAALQAWRKIDAIRFPNVDPWRAREPWITSNERRVTRQLNELHDERDRAISAFAQRELQLRSEVQEAQLQAEQGPRRLLTAQSDVLVHAVKDAFDSLGYEVTDVDEQLETGMARVEDLHITDPDQPDLRILAEVKGSTGGAKARDLLQISQHVVRYLQREGTPPDRAWYVVNQFLDKDPDLRLPPLVGDADGVDAFADGGGLILDTRDLFQLAEMVSEGRLAPKDARIQLASQLGVFDLGNLPEVNRPAP